VQQEDIYSPPQPLTKQQAVIFARMGVLNVIQSARLALVAYLVTSKA